MTTIAVTMVKDEVDVIASTVGWMLGQVDHVIVADNGSTDGTREILRGLPVELVDDPDPAYYQSKKMSHLAALARQQGATWVIPFDADEIWTSRWGRLADVLDSHTPDFGIVKAALYDHVATGIDPSPEAEPDPVRRLHWRRREPVKLPKVAARTACGLVIEQGNHWARHPIPARATDDFPLTIHHFPYRSVGQFIRKARNGYAAYAATVGLPDDVGGHWRQWGDKPDEWLEQAFRTWFYRQDPRTDIVIEGEYQTPLVRDPVR